MSLSPPRAVDSTRPGPFRENLARKVIITLLVLSLLPVAFIGSATYFRTRRLLSGQVENQIQTIIQNQSKQLSLISIPGSKALTDLSVQGNLNRTLLELYDAPQDLKKINQIQSDYFYRYLAKSDDSSLSVFDQLWGITNDGKVLVASDSQWIGEDFSQLEVFQALKNTNHSLFAYDPQPLYVDEMVVFSAYNIKDTNGDPFLTILGATLSNTPLTILGTTNSFFKASNTYLFSNSGQVISVTQTGQQLFNLKPNPEHSQQLQELVSSWSGFGEFLSLDNTDVLAYGEWIPELQMGLALEIPKSEIYGEFNSLLRLNVVVLLGILLITGLVTYLIANRMISPLRTLITQARKLAEGDLSQRTESSRHDEIGLLAYTFNTMAGQLSTLYQSLEQKVEERTEQLRSVSDIIQLATSSTRQEDILQKTVDLLADRFDYLYTGIFVLNETGTSATLKSEAGPITQERNFREYRVRITEQTLIGRVAAQNRPESANPTPQSIENWPLLTDQTQSEAAVPIQVGGEVYGVLYLQSAKPDSFGEETQVVLKTLSDQIAIGLQKIRLIESTEINLEETSTLYRTSLRITQAGDKTGLIQTLLEGLKDLSMFTAVYTVEKNAIRLLGMNNPGYSTQADAVQDLSFPLNNIYEHFTESSLVVLNDLTVSTQFTQILSAFIQQGCASAALLGIKEAGKLDLVIVLAFQHQTLLTDTRLQPYVNLVHVASNALDRMRATKGLELRLNELQTMSGFSKSISNEMDLNHLYQISHELISDLVGQDLTFTIAILDKENEKIEIPFLYENSTSSSLDPIPLGEGLTSHIFQTREPLLLNHNIAQEAHQLGAKIIGTPPKSWLGVPLMVSGEVIGAVILQDSLQENRFDQHDLDLLSTLALQIGAAIHNVQLIKGLQEALRVFDRERFLLNTLLENTPDQIFFKDKEGKYLRVSNSYASQFSIQPEALIGKSDFELFDSETSYRIAEEEQALLLGGKNQLDTTTQKQSAAGEEIWYQISKIPLLDNASQPMGILGIYRDITDLKLAEETARIRAQQLQTAAEIARDTTGTLDINQFLSQAVNLIRDRFGFYHASIFLIDPMGENAVLRESTGEAGEQLKRTHHKLAVGSQSLVGQATQNQAPVIINDVSSDPNYYPNPFLPDTRSELVLPLVVGKQLLGALDVQSTQTDAFLSKDLEILQILADQLAAAISSANLYMNSQKNLYRQRALQETTVAITASTTIEELLQTAANAIHQILPKDHIAIYLLNRQNLLELQSFAGDEKSHQLPETYSLEEGIVGASARQHASILVKDTVTDQRFPSIEENTRSRLVVPILYNDQLLGILKFESETVAAFDESDQEIFSVWASNIGSALSNFHLLSQIRAQVEKQRTINQISSSIHRTVDMRLILETSAVEICKALGAKRASIQINPELNSAPGNDNAAEYKEEI